MATAAFTCACGQITGSVRQMPERVNHLVCYCDSCRAGALYCGADLPADVPLDLCLIQPAQLSIASGLDQLAPFAFSPKGILRWKARCCGVQMFSTQPDPKIAFMSVVTARLTSPDLAGPIVTRAFAPRPNGKAAHEGKGALAKFIMRSVIARLTGAWRKTPLYDTNTGDPIATITLVSKAEKAALLS